ncbi:MAG: outer membrane protein assembly factor BamA [Elusimicrobiota bacterium]
MIHKMMRNRPTVITAAFFFGLNIGLLSPALNGVLSAAEINRVSVVTIQGNINIKEKAIRGKIKTKIGDIFSAENIKNDLNEILSLGHFEDATVEFDSSTYRVTFKVREKPFLKKIDFKGNKKFSKGRLRDDMTAKEDEYMDTMSLDRDRQKIYDLYAEEGYTDTVVSYEPTIDRNTNRATVTFFITEGKKVNVESVRIAGTKFFNEKKVLRQIQTKKKKVFKEKIMAEDIEKIRNFYTNSGFESVDVSTPAMSYNEDRTKVSITINISEGPRYRIGGIGFSGMSVYTEEDLHKVIQIKTKQLYNKEKIELSRQSMAELYSEKGYLRVEIVPEFTKYLETGVMDINFNITENSIVYLDRIYIDGLAQTKEFVIRREILLEEKQPFNSIKLRRSVEKIYNLGFIDEVKVDLQDTGSPDTADLVLNVTEGKPGMLSAGAGYSSIDKLVGTLQVTHMNLFGRAQRLNLMWEFGDRRQNYEISWTEPWFMHKPLSLGTGLYDLTRKQYYSDMYAYTYNRQGADIKVGPRLSDYLNLFFIYSYERITITDIQPGVLTVAGSELTSSFTGQVIYDNRDNVFDASRGSRNSFSLQLAGGPFSGDVHFYKPLIRSSWFLKTVWKFVLSANATLGYVESYNNYRMTDPNMFHVGGADSVRGYTYNTLNPPEGGRVMFIGNIEYKFPIVQEKGRTILQAVLFYDVGAGWTDFSKFNFNTGATDEWTYYRKWDNLMKSGWGFGIRFTTPVFPIRLDWGWPVHPKIGQTSPEFYFSMGQMF